MTDAQVTAVIVIALAAHVAALAAALMGRGVQPMLGLDVAVAVVVLAYVALHPKAFAFGIDWQIVGLAIFEMVVLLVAVMAMRGVRPAILGAWVAFGVHALAFAGALVFALTFKMNRLF